MQVLWRRLWIVLLAALLAAAIAVGTSFLSTPVYEGSIRVLVGQDQGVVTDNPADAQGLQQVTQTVAELASTRPVAEAVIDEVGLAVTPEEFLENLSVEQTAETQIIEISYTHPDPETAANVANATGELFSNQISQISTEANAVTATLWERSSTPDSPSSPQPLRNGVLALALGLMLGVGLAFLLEHLDDSWRSPEEAEKISGVPTFGVIREFEAQKKSARKEKK